MRTKYLVCGCVVLSVIVVAMATPCFAVNLIYGCVKGNGDLQIVSGPGLCKAGQTPISWPAAESLTQVSGWVRYDGVAILGDGFTSKYENGVYYITFNQDFIGDPGCAISLLSSPPPTEFCAILGLGPSILDVNCTSQVGFAFVCVGNIN